MDRDNGLKAMANRRRGRASPTEVKRFKTAIADCVARKWRGLQKDDGTEDTHSAKRCLEIFEDPETEHVFTWVCECANSEEDYLKELVEDAVGN